jgi:hypothetical protein
MTAEPNIAPTRQPRFFEVPRFGWILLALWAALNLFGLFMSHVPLDGRIVGVFIGRIIWPFIFAWLLTLPIWYLSRRSQKAARLAFNIVLVLGVFSLWTQGVVDNIDKAHKNQRITNDGSGQKNAK